MGDVLLITDPGPDCDDIKALLVLCFLDTRKQCRVAGVVANGGGHPELRARLARAVLNSVGSNAEEYVQHVH